jgi:hypothetical protein
MSYTTSYTTFYTVYDIWCYLWGFPPETMADNVEGVASCLGPPVEQVAFPFDATKRVQMTTGTPNNVIEKNIVELVIQTLRSTARAMPGDVGADTLRGGASG